MNDGQLLRYARHILLDELDVAGQERILAATVAVIGVGGLGSPVAMYLASSGVGTVHLVDDDEVALSNLQRQIAHTTQTLGWSKVESAQRTLHALNPEVVVHTHRQRADDQWLDRYLPECDVVIDCSDNFQTRHLLNRYSVKHRVPLVSGAVVRFDGQISVFDPRMPDAPCYACLFAPDEHFANDLCATLGVFAPLVGVVGAMQAAEALKLIAGIGQPLVGQLLTVEARSMTWQNMLLSANPACPVCGTHRENYSPNNL